MLDDDVSGQWTSLASFGPPQASSFASVQWRELVINCFLKVTNELILSIFPLIRLNKSMKISFPRSTKFIFFHSFFATRFNLLLK
ncbi:unnamed protein product [Hymenolepis diminuta]|uniref:Uncharacterized protein n=1 Tax=Hymenolepis diminuta TaxID=6216 RepID=A0A564XU74_HYMDI|nr:unnamed protein product [Hymenolepis diminuta]